MTNTTKNTTKSIFLALSVALTMGVANATAVPGMSSDVFEFNQVGSNVVPAAGAGFDAIANINNILNSMATTGGSDINTNNYWNSFVSDVKTQTFDYASAKPMIEELIFTVSGEIFTGSSTVNNGYIDSGNTSVNGTGVRDNALTKVSAISSRLATAQDVTDAIANDPQSTLSVGDALYEDNWLDGGLKESGEAAVALMGTIGYNILGANTNAAATNDDASPLGAHTTVTGGDLSEAVSLKHDISTVTYTSTSTSLADLTNSVLANAGADFLASSGAAKLSSVKAFNNANTLIQMISLQLKNGYLLDVNAATAAVSQVIDHHNGFLSASIVSKAKGLKGMIKNVGLQMAATGVGKGARTACTDQGAGLVVTPEESGCVQIGEKFKDISQQIDTLNVDAQAYNDAIDAINVLAGNLTTFNSTNVTTYAGAGQADAINGQFGTIMVNSTSGKGKEIFNAFEAQQINPYGFDSWTTTVAADILAEDGSTVLFDTELDIEFDGNDLFTVEGGLAADLTSTDTNRADNDLVDIK